MKMLSAIRLFTLHFLTLTFVFTVLPAYATDGKDSVEFHIAPYVWLAGQNGSVATLPGLPQADIDVNFYDDIFGNINGAIMLVAGARKGPFGIVMDVSYTDIESDTTVPARYFTTVTSQTQTWMVSAAAFYRFLEAERYFLDLMGGARYWSVDQELALSGGSLGMYAIDNREDWVDPIVGLKGLTALGATKFFISGFFVIGGFGAGSDFMWDGNLNLGYHWTETFSTTIGYRYLDVDYENDDYLYDVSQDGIILGLSWRF